MEGPGYVRKETGWMTNHLGLAQLLQGECTNMVAGKPWHRYVHLIRLARPAARYPPALVRVVLGALRDYLVESGVRWTQLLQVQFLPERSFESKNSLGCDLDSYKNLDSK